MEAHGGIALLRDHRVASRKAEEAALRRYRAAGWLESMVGPLDLPPQPSEAEFVSCLRNGLVLCNLINKIQPGVVPRVIDNHSFRLNLEAPPPPAYQYFENIRNFLAAVEQLKQPAFEASDLERDTIESGSTSKIVDCVLALKTFHEWKMYSGGDSSCKYAKSPAVLNSSGKFNSHVASTRSEICKRLDLKSKEERDNEDLLVKALCDRISSAKENIDENNLASLLIGALDSSNEFAEIISSLLQGHEHCTRSSQKVVCNNHRQILKVQEKELGDMKELLSKMKTDFISSHSQLQRDISQLGTKIQGLSFSALGYRRAIKENRSLYNAIQDLKGNIRVFCRIRPSFDSGALPSVELDGEDGTLSIVDPSMDLKKIFRFDRVFEGTATQEEVYRDTQPLIRSVMDGYNICIFAYGQTGSGKTHTMFGKFDGASDDMGIIHRALNDLFEISCSRSDCIKYEVAVQMVEIYNDQVRDLLGDDPSTAKVEIRSCSGNGGLSVPDAGLHAVRSTEDIRRLMRLGERNRVQYSTALNERSSRSHSVLTVHVRGEEISGGAICGRMHLVDLAGSERVDKSEVSGDRLKEAQHINRSLSCLGDVMAALGQKSSHVPYRNCKLTQLLQDSLGGQAKTLMFAHVSPEADSYEETISTLRFAQRVSTVELGAAKRNKENSEVRKLREQVEDLKRAIARSELTPPTSGQMTSNRSRRSSMEGSLCHGRTPAPQIRSSILTPPSLEDCRPCSTLPEDADPPGSSFESRLPRPESGFRSALKQRTPDFSINPAAESSQEAGGGDAGRMPSDRQNSRLKDDGSSRSHIRKSLQTFGRLINGDRRSNHRTPPEKPSPVLSPCSLPAKSRASRRQSLINIPSPGVRASRRSSLGGKPAPAESNSCRSFSAIPGKRNKATTLSSVHPSSKLTGNR